MVIDNDTGHAEPVAGGRWVVPAGGVAAAALLVLLVYAVLHTAGDATHPPQPVLPSMTESPGTTPTAHSTLSTPPSTFYPAPSLQTSIATSGPAVPSPTGAPPSDPGDSASDIPAPAPTTIFNPYATTTPPNADSM